MVLENDTQRLYTGSADTKARCFDVAEQDSVCIKAYSTHRDTVSTLRSNGDIREWSTQRALTHRHAQVGWLAE